MPQLQEEKARRRVVGALLKTPPIRAHHGDVREDDDIRIVETDWPENEHGGGSKPYTEFYFANYNHVAPYE